MNQEIGLKWLKQARHDIDMAEKNITIDGFDVASFLAEQAIEKLLKAIYAAEGLSIPRSHYIDEMARDLNIPEFIRGDILELSADYTLYRYPDVSNRIPYEEYTKEIATEKVQHAKNVFEALKNRYEILEKEK